MSRRTDIEQSALGFHNYSLSRKLGFSFTVALISLAGACASAEQSPDAARSARNLIILSLDGLRPDFYRDPAFRTPHLKSLASKGASFDGLLPVFPSLTYPNHTTISTGARPARHGVVNNRVFDQEKGPTPRWYLDSSWIRVPALWDVARENGRRVAIFNWPATRGARADWVIPEVFPEDGFDMGEIWKLTAQATDPALLRELIRFTGEDTYTDTLQHDRWIAKAAQALLREKRPDLLMLHLTHADVAQHLTGRNSQATHEAVSQLDGIVGQFTSGLDLESSCLLILGDHGFLDVRKEIRPNAIFASRGWIRGDRGKLREWQVMADVAGAVAAVYARDPAKGREALELLRANQKKGHYRVVTREELDRFEAFPGAICALEPERGYAVSPEFAPGTSWTAPKRELRAEHGQMSRDPWVHAGLIAVGGCAQPGSKPGFARMEDIAPTVGAWLGFAMPPGPGQILNLGRNR